MYMHSQNKIHYALGKDMATAHNFWLDEWLQQIIGMQ